MERQVRVDPVCSLPYVDAEILPLARAVAPDCGCPDRGTHRGDGERLTQAQCAGEQGVAAGDRNVSAGVLPRQCQWREEFVERVQGTGIGFAAAGHGVSIGSRIAGSPELMESVDDRRRLREIVARRSGASAVW
jgi:hypothetical protein